MTQFYVRRDDEIIAEGMLLSNGCCVVTWPNTVLRSSAVFESVEEVERLHAAKVVPFEVEK